VQNNIYPSSLKWGHNNTSISHSKNVLTVCPFDGDPKVAFDQPSTGNSLVQFVMAQLYHSEMNKTVIISSAYVVSNLFYLTCYLYNHYSVVLFSLQKLLDTSVGNCVQR
jgi:hypothetical protein